MRTRRRRICRGCRACSSDRRRRSCGTSKTTSLSSIDAPTMSDHLQNHPPSLIWVSGDAILSLRLVSSMRPLLLPFQAFRIRTSRSETSQPLHDRRNLYTDLWNPTQQKVQDFRDGKFRIVVKQASKFTQQKEELHDNSHKLSRLLSLVPRLIMQVYKVHHFAACWHEEVKDSKGVRVNPKSYAPSVQRGSL